MFKVNDAVLYGIQGVCNIIDIETKRIGGSDIEYFVLKPVYNVSSTIYVPVNNQHLTAKMRKILSAQEIYDIIHSIPQEELIWIENEAERKEKYNAIIKAGDRRDLVKLIKTLYLRQQSLKEQRKKLHLFDERFMRDAEKMLYEEFAYVLNIEQNQVVPFIAEKIGR